MRRVEFSINSCLVSGRWKVVNTGHYLHFDKNTLDSPDQGSGLLFVRIDLSNYPRFKPKPGKYYIIKGRLSSRTLNRKTYNSDEAKMFLSSSQEYWKQLKNSLISTSNYQHQLSVLLEKYKIKEYPRPTIVVLDPFEIINFDESELCFNDVTITGKITRTPIIKTRDFCELVLRVKKEDTSPGSESGFDLFSVIIFSKKYNSISKNLGPGTELIVNGSLVSSTEIQQNINGKEYCNFRDRVSGLIHEKIPDYQSIEMEFPNIRKRVITKTRIICKHLDIIMQRSLKTG